MSQSCVALRMSTTLIQKYDIHFNFILTKPINEIVYNHTHATPTIAFKDAIILADTNQYLKRYYFLRNALDKEEIYDRINLLAEFYGNAVLLRYEYPLMVLTRTKSIFMKRLKRMKKILVEEGSSDQSKSERDEKPASINSSNFLKSLSSSQLDRKSLDEGHNLQLDFSLFKDNQYETYDIYDQDPSFQQQRTSPTSFNLINLAKNLTSELVLDAAQNQQQVRHLTLDFQDFDRQDIIRKYQRIMEKENCRQSSKQSTARKQDSLLRSNHTNQQPLKIRQLMEKKPMASSITITALEDMPLEPNSPKPNDNRKKSMLSPSRIHQQPDAMKRSSYYQYEMEHNNFVNNQMVIAEDQMEDSPKHPHMKIKKFPSMDQQEFNLYNNLKRPEGSTGKRFLPPEPQTSREIMRDKGGFVTPVMKYSSFLNDQQRQPYRNLEGERFSNLPFRSSPDYDYKDKYEPSPSPRFSNPAQPNRMTSINININNLEEKKQPHRVNVKYSKSKYGEDFAEEERNYRAEKKRKIREKAAALLNRVKSQEYMRTGFEGFEKGNQYGNAEPAYYQRYY